VKSLSGVIGDILLDEDGSCSEGREEGDEEGLEEEVEVAVCEADLLVAWKGTQGFDEESYHGSDPAKGSDERLHAEDGSLLQDPS